MSECTAEIAAGDQIAHRMNDFHARVTATFIDLEQQIIHKFDIRAELDGATLTGIRRPWLSSLTRAVLSGLFKREIQQSFKQARMWMMTCFASFWAGAIFTR